MKIIFIKNNFFVIKEITSYPIYRFNKTGSIFAIPSKLLQNLKENLLQQ